MFIPVLSTIFLLLILYLTTMFASILMQSKYSKLILTSKFEQEFSFCCKIIQRQFVSFSSSKSKGRLMTTLTLRPLDVLSQPYGLLVLNQPILIENDVLRKIWNSARIRGLVDGGANRFIEFYKNDEKFALPSFLCGDLDSIHSDTLTYFQNEPNNVQVFKTPDQNETDFTKAINILQLQDEEQKLEVKKIIVLSEHSGRLDQIMGNLHTLLKTKDIAQIFILNQDNITFLVPKGQVELVFNQEVLNQNGGKNTCGILPLEGPTKVKSTGLKWELDGVYGFNSDLILSTSNVVVSSRVVFSTDANLVFTFSKKDLSSLIK